MFWAVVPFLWVNFVCILEKRLTLQQNVFVCWSFCLIQCFFGAMFLSLCFWVNRCYVLRERETLYCYRTVFVYFVLYHVCLVSCLFRCVCGSTDVMFWGGDLLHCCKICLFVEAFLVLLTNIFSFPLSFSPILFSGARCKRADSSAAV